MNVYDRKDEARDGRLDEPEQRAFFVCASCGTMASTNSRKHYADDQDIDTDDEYRGIATETAVRMTPPCPCGEDVFNFAFLQSYSYE